jgi:hypothetical protein
MRAEGIDFKQCSNPFLRCTHPQNLQELADSLTAHDLSSCGQKWLACLTPFFKESERKTCGCQHRLFFSQVEYCDNLIFHRRAALDHANRTIGQPSKITTIFGRKVTKFYKGKLQTVIEDLDRCAHLPHRLLSNFLAEFRPEFGAEVLRLEQLPNLDLGLLVGHGIGTALDPFDRLLQRSAFP